LPPLIRPYKMNSQTPSADERSSLSA